MATIYPDVPITPLPVSADTVVLATIYPDAGGSQRVGVGSGRGRGYAAGARRLGGCLLPPSTGSSPTPGSTW